MKFPSKFSESSNFSFIGFLTTSFMLGFSSLTMGQASKFELVTGTNGNDDAKCIIQTLDSGYAVVGSTSGFGNGQSDIYLTKISKTGTVTWQQAIGGAGIDIGNSLIQTPDSGFAIAGYSNSDGAAGYDVYLAKTDKNGMLEWSNNYGGFDWDFGNSIIQTNSGDFVICGSTYSFGQGNGDVYLMKTNSAGILLWDSAYGGSQEDAGKSVCEATDGGYFITGYTKSFGSGKDDVYLLKTDSDGNLAWARSYGGTAEDNASEGKLTTDGGLIVAASSKSFDTGTFYENWFIKTDSTGDTLWTRRNTATFDRLVTSVSLTYDGGYIFAGDDNVFGQYNMFLYKTDAGGYYQDYTNYGGGKAENSFSVKQTFDSGYVVVGVTESYGPGTPNIYVLKTDANLYASGTVVVVVGVKENETANKNISVYPNPASDHFTVKTEERSLLEIFDATGRITSTNQLIRGNNNIPVADLPDGIYFIQIRNENYLASGKIIVRH